MTNLLRRLSCLLVPAALWSAGAQAQPFIVARIKAGARANGVAVHPDGSKLYVANGRSGTVSVIDTRRGTKTRDVSVGKLPWGVVMGR